MNINKAKIITMNNFKRTYTFSVDVMTICDLDKLVEMYAEYLNYGDGVRPHCISVLEDGDTVAVKCLDGTEIVGILIYTKGIALSGGHHELVKEIEQKKHGKTIYTCDAVMVKKDLRGMDLQGVMSKFSLPLLIEKGAQCTLHELWVYPNGMVPGHKLPHYSDQVEFIGRFNMFYKDFHHFGYFCPVCGKDCICGADIYVTDIP